mgnify:CR=1 FL=1
MQETLFLQKIQDSFTFIESIIDNWNERHDLVIDINKESNVLEIEFENTKEIILNAQTPMRQLWMASELGAYHFKFSDERKKWIDTRGNGEFIELFLKHSKELSKIDFII